ncbi:MAG TPA: winged helix-turn-helix domain-containing protein [Solirubrobacterales bacterium]|nr:winged helix-turn-helix domain-containing protein [Solirubrobacterales bacterium]
MAVVFEDELRLKIITELHMREMSPSQFFEEFGGGSASRVARHFNVLAKHGWLRFTRTVPSKGPRGGDHHLYRAPELAVLDEETWALLPHSIKVSWTCIALRQLTERVRDALAEETFDSRPERHLTWTPLVLDRAGWDRVMARMNALFVSLLEEQVDAKIRIYHSGEKPILATVGLLAFESPMSDFEGIGLAPIEPEESSLPFSSRLAKVFADEICLRIVAELNLREMSVAQFHREFGGELKGATLSDIYYRFKRLEKSDWLCQVNEKTGGSRGHGKGQLYRARGPAIFDNKTWASLPPSIKKKKSGTTFQQLSQEVEKAVNAGTFDSRDDRHLTWSLFLLDQQGWERMTAAVDALFAFVLNERDRAESRIGAESEEGLSRMTVGLMAFESPKDATKAP